VVLHQLPVLPLLTSRAFKSQGNGLREFRVQVPRRHFYESILEMPAWCPKEGWLAGASGIPNRFQRLALHVTDIPYTQMFDTSLVNWSYRFIWTRAVLPPQCKSGLQY
jgi:hypothetical protein